MNGFFKTARPVLVIAGVALIFIIAFAVVSLFWRKDEPKQAYDITGVLADESTLYSLSDNFGKTSSVLIFFDIDTGKAAELLEQLNAIVPEYTADVVAVATSDRPVAEQVQLLAEKNISFQHILFDVDGEMAKTYRVNGTPITYFIDKNGVVQDAFVSSISEKSLRKALAALD